MAPQDFAIGDVVEVRGMPESSDMNGLVGTLTRTIGKGRWALKVEGEDRTKVILEENLVKFVPKGERKPSEKFFIVGTWNDWDPKEMLWKEETSCFEFPITLGHGGAESFKILLNGPQQTPDWDMCIYPDRKDACPHQAHQLKGPDDGGLDEEWTVGMHPADEASFGDTFNIKLFVTHDGKPKRITWDKTYSAAEAQKKAQEEAHKKAQEEEVMRNTVEEARQKKEAQKISKMKFEPEEAIAPPAQPQLFNPGTGAAYTAGMPPAPPRDLDFPKQMGGANWQQVSELGGEEYVRRESEARERLAKRLEAAAKLGMGAPMIRNEDGKLGEDNIQPELLQLALVDEKEERELQVEANKERYRRSIEENVRERAAMTQATSRKSGPCTECSETTSNMYGQNFVCESCLEAWQELREEGWDGNVLCGGLPAAQRAQQICAASRGQLTTMESRLQVMRDYGPSFRRY